MSTINNITNPASHNSTLTNTTFSQILLAEYVAGFASIMFSLALLSLLLRKILCCKSVDQPLLALAHFETWFAISVSFTMFNKFVFNYWGNGEFNLPFFVTSMHMTVKFISMLSFVKCYRKERISWPSYLQIFKYYIPIGIMTGFDIAFVNLAVSYAAVSLVVVTKTMGIGFTLSISVCLGLQKCTKILVAIVVVVATGACMALWKEPDFQMTGVILASLSSLCGAVRWSMTQFVSQKEKASVSTLILFTAPSAMIVTLIASMATETATLSNLRNGSYGDGTGWVLVTISLVGGFITLALLVVEISLVTLTSALATDVGAKVKDMALILISMVVYGDRLTTTNMIGFLIVCVGVVSYSIYKKMGATKLEQVEYSAVQWDEDEIWEDDGTDDDNFVNISVEMTKNKT